MTTRKPKLLDLFCGAIQLIPVQLADRRRDLLAHGKLGKVSKTYAAGIRVGFDAPRCGHVEAYGLNQGLATHRRIHNFLEDRGIDGEGELLMCLGHGAYCIQIACPDGDQENLFCFLRIRHFCIHRSSIGRYSCHARSIGTPSRTRDKAAALFSIPRLSVFDSANEIVGEPQLSCTPKSSVFGGVSLPQKRTRKPRKPLHSSYIYHTRLLDIYGV
jgi:hypothetical protein